MKQVNSSVFWPVVGVLVVWLAALTWSSVGSAPTAAERAASGGGPVVAFVHGDSLQRSIGSLQGIINVPGSNINTHNFTKFTDHIVRLNVDILPRIGAYLKTHLTRLAQ